MAFQICHTLNKSSMVQFLYFFVKEKRGCLVRFISFFIPLCEEGEGGGVVD